MPCLVYHSRGDLVGDNVSMRICNGGQLWARVQGWGEVQTRTEQVHLSNLWKSPGRPLPCKELSCVDTKVTVLPSLKDLLRFNTKLLERSPAPTTHAQRT